jgi:hypothetical protein
MTLKVRVPLEHPVLYVVGALLTGLLACGPSPQATVVSDLPAGQTDQQPEDALATQVAQALAATLAAASTGPIGGGWFIDTFDQPELLEAWSWIREDPAAWDLTGRPGWLRLDTGNYFMIGEGGNAPLLLVPAPDDDFELRARLDFRPTEDFQFSGLLVYQDDDNFVALGRAYCGITTTCPGDGVYLDSDQAFLTGAWESISRGGLPFGPIWLRLVRQGTTYTGFWSIDADVWTEVGSYTADLTPASVGLLAANAAAGAPSASGHFDLFQVMAIVPVNLGTTDICPEPMDSLRFVGHSYLASGHFLVTLGKPEGFEARDYTLLVDEVPYACSTLGERVDRIYCTNASYPRSGLLPIQLLSSDSSCSYQTPLDAISVIPRQPTAAPGGKYY